MASVNYNSFLSSMASGNVAPGVDTFYALPIHGCMPNQDTHTKRSDVTGEVVGGVHRRLRASASSCARRNRGTSPASARRRAL